MCRSTRNQCIATIGASVPRTGVKESHNLVSLQLFSGGTCSQLVAAIVVLMVGVTLGPGPRDLVILCGVVQLHPQILIDHGFLRCGLPPVPLPAVDPGGNAVLDVLGIGN